MQKSEVIKRLSELRHMNKTAASADDLAVICEQQGELLEAVCCTALNIHPSNIKEVKPVTSEGSEQEGE